MVQAVRVLAKSAVLALLLAGCSREWVEVTADSRHAICSDGEKIAEALEELPRLDRWDWVQRTEQAADWTSVNIYSMRDPDVWVQDDSVHRVAMVSLVRTEGGVPRVGCAYFVSRVGQGMRTTVLRLAESAVTIGPGRIVVVVERGRYDVIYGRADYDLDGVRMEAAF